MMRVLLTGSAGFLGRHFRTALEARGDDVWCVDPAADPAIAHAVDLRDFLWNPTATECEFDLVVHLAGVVGGRAAIDNTPLDLAVNLELDAALARWLAGWRTRQPLPPHLVYVSSSAVYPVALQNARLHGPLQEDDVDLDFPNKPDQVYGWAKLTGEVLCRYLRDEGVLVTVVRPFSGYGEDQSLDYPFPSFVDRAVRRLDPFVIWSDGRQVRDLVHVDDVVGATLALADAGVDDAVNVCTGRATSFVDLARLVCGRVDHRPRFERVVDAPRGVSYRVGDPTKMLKYYTPRVSLEEGVDRAISWRARKDLG